MRQKKSNGVARGLTLILLFSFFSYLSVSPTTIISELDTVHTYYDNAIGDKGYYTFDAEHSVLGFVWFPFGFYSDGYDLDFNIIPPVGGTMKFASDPTLTLSGDLLLTSSVSIIGDVSINGEGDTVGIGHAVVLGGDLDLNYTITFVGDTIIDGQGNCLDIDDGYLWIDTNKTLTLRNLVLKNLHDSNLVMMARTSQLALDNVCIWLDNDYSFTQGRLFFYDDVIISGSPHTFSYKTTESSYIVGQTKLTIDHGVTFSYDPAEAHRDLINMEDATSYLCLDGCSLYSTPTGLRFTKGAVLFDNLVTLSADGDGIGDGIVFGGGVDDDVTTKVLSGARVEAYGHISFIV